VFTLCAHPETGEVVTPTAAELDPSGDALPLRATRSVNPQDVTVDAALLAANGQIMPPQIAASQSVLPKLKLVGDALHLAAQGGPRYAEVRSLGRGGMGEVALVEDRDIGRPVALKRLLPEGTSPGVVARFVDEVRTIGRLEHPNIVPIHDVGVDDDGRYFFVMKYVDGETLESIIERLKAQNPAAVEQYDVQARVQIFEGLLLALEYAHSHGVLHRDLKPANVMVGRYGEVVLMDWGVATTFNQGGVAAGVAGPGPATDAPTTRLSATHAGSIVGTPHYMSPEQTRGAKGKLDHRSDLFSACVLFHELLGLNHRHDDKSTLMAVLMAVNTSEAPYPGTMFAPHPAQPDGINAAYAHFLNRGLQRDPDKRWQSAREMLDELDNIQAGRCRVQCPVTLTKRIAGETNLFIDRRPMQAFMAAVVASLAFVGMTAYTVMSLL
jgi:serine/threonine-protein kinase